MEIPDNSWIEIIAGQKTLLDAVERYEKNIGDLQEDLHDPDDGLFTRVKANTNFRRGAKKALWIMTAAIVGLMSRLIADFIMGR